MSNLDSSAAHLEYIEKCWANGGTLDRLINQESDGELENMSELPSGDEEGLD